MVAKQKELFRIAHLVVISSENIFFRETRKDFILQRGKIEASHNQLWEGGIKGWYPKSTDQTEVLL